MCLNIRLCKAERQYFKLININFKYTPRLESGVL